MRLWTSWKDEEESIPSLKYRVMIDAQTHPVSSLSRRKPTQPRQV